MGLLTKSIRWRFVLWLAFLLICVLSGFGVTAFQLHRLNRFDQLDGELTRRVAALSSALREPPLPVSRGAPPSERDRGPSPPPDGEFRAPRRPGPPPTDGPHNPGPLHDLDGLPGTARAEIRIPSEVTSLFAEASPNSLYYILWLRGNGGLLARSPNGPTDIPQPARPGKDTGTFFRNRGALREAFQYTERGDGILVGRSIETELAATRQFALWLIAGGLAVLALGIGGVWLLAGRALSPVKAISATAMRISAGNLSERINTSETDDELGQVARTLNSTFARLEAAFAQQKQFTANASHELRTPLAVMISEAQTTLTRERSSAEYRETVQACLETAQQMRQITESLLQLARFDVGQEKIRREPVNLAEVARDTVQSLHPMADARGLKISCALGLAATGGDANLLGQVIANLLTNAIQHNKPRGEVRLTTRATSTEAELIVADTGPGIAPEDLPHIFERFYRADKARAHTNSNSGLGLAICKAIVDAHGGTIEVTSEPGEGTRFSVRLPA